MLIQALIPKNIANTSTIPDLLSPILKHEMDVSN